MRSDLLLLATFAGMLLCGGVRADLKVLDKPLWIFLGQQFRVCIEQPEGSGELKVQVPSTLEMFDTWDQDAIQLDDEISARGAALNPGGLVSHGGRGLPPVAGGRGQGGLQAGFGGDQLIGQQPGALRGLPGVKAQADVELGRAVAREPMQGRQSECQDSESAAQDHKDDSQALFGAGGLARHSVRLALVGRRGSRRSLGQRRGAQQET